MQDEDLAAHRPWASLLAREQRRTCTGMLRRGYGQKEFLKDAFRWAERLAILPGSFRSHRLYEENYDTPLQDRVAELEVPVHVIAGECDMVAPAESARAYVDALHAPVKRWHTIPQAAHSPFVDAPQAFEAALRQSLGDQH